MNTLKRFLPIILVLTLLAGLLIPASAAAITAGNPQSVTVVNDETPVMLQFTPTKTGYYHFYSYSSQGYDPYGYIMDTGLEILAQGDDTGDSMDFSITCYLTAGNTYYLAATCYSGSARYTVQIDALPTATAIAFDQTAYVGNVGGCLYPLIQFDPQDSAQESITMTSSNQQVVRIGEEGDFYLGIPGTATVTAVSASGLTATCTVTVQAPPTLALDTPWTLDAALGEQYLSFVAPSDGWYGIYSEGADIDPQVEVLDSMLEGILEDDESLPGHNFFAPVYLEAGELCYFGFRTSNETGTAQVTLTKLNTATDIALPAATLTGYVGTDCWLKAIYEPQISIPETLTWKSSNESVVTVDDSGTVNFLKVGNAVITVTSETGKSHSIKVTVLATPANATAWGNCGPNLQWQLSSSGALTVTGSGDMYDLYDNNNHWDAYCHLIKTVSLPEGLTSIGYGAFMNCYNLTQITIADGVRQIGNAAFSGCSALARVTLPKNLESLGSMAFEYCYQLEQIQLPDTLKRIPRNAFLGCTSLSTVTLPGNLVSIGNNAFSFCPIRSIALPETLEVLGYGAFANSDLTQITLPQGLTELQDYTLLNCSLEELTIPGSVTHLGSGFASGNPLHTLRFLGNIPSFDEYALDSLSVTAYYPAGNKTWAPELLQNYGGNVTWIPEGNPGVSLSGSINVAATLTLKLDQEILQTTHSENGSYIFEDLQPGVYTLTASATNHVARTYTITVSEEPLTQDLKLHLIGDIDGNGKVNIGDVAKLNAHIKGTSLLTDEYILDCANVNGGKLNMGDTAGLYAHIRGTKPLY